MPCTGRPEVRNLSAGASIERDRSGPAPAVPRCCFGSQLGVTFLRLSLGNEIASRTHGCATRRVDALHRDVEYRPVRLPNPRWVRIIDRFSYHGRGHVDSSALVQLLEQLTGEPVPFVERLDGVPVAIEPGEKGLGYSQFNELLLLAGLDRITHAFFAYLLTGSTEYEPGMAFESFEQVKTGVSRQVRSVVRCRSSPGNTRPFSGIPAVFVQQRYAYDSLLL